jgi:hypothetical protein
MVLLCSVFSVNLPNQMMSLLKKKTVCLWTTQQQHFLAKMRVALMKVLMFVLMGSAVSLSVINLTISLIFAIFL